jgi:hypothetical protein
MYSLDSERETPQPVDIAFAVDIVLFTGANRFSTFRMSARTGTQSVWWGNHRACACRTGWARGRPSPFR